MKPRPYPAREVTGSPPRSPRRPFYPYAESGRVLYEYDAHKPRLIASTTKLMTALVAVEQTDDLDEVVTVKGEWLGSEGSSQVLLLAPPGVLFIHIAGDLLKHLRHQVHNPADSVPRRGRHRQQSPPLLWAKSLP